MNSYVRALLGLGAHGAAANARRACQQRVDEARRLDARLAQIRPGRSARRPSATAVDLPARRAG